MAKFESALGSKEVAGGNFRTFSVSDETEQPNITPQSNVNIVDKDEKLAGLEARIASARQAKIDNRISPEAKKRIEILTGIGRAIKNVDIDEHVFTLRTLTVQEQKELSLLGFSLANENRGDIQFELRSQILARSLCEIDGQSFAAIVGSTDLDVRIMGIEQLDEVIASLLMTKYQELTYENKKKYGIHTDKEVKEVVEDIKKA